MAEKENIYDRHSELFHYTDKKGLLGILESQTLWATHFEHLNDKSELQLMRDVLADRIFPIVKETIFKRFRESGFKQKRKMSKLGGPIAIARKEAIGLADSFYNVGFADMPSGSALAVPYITSFCAHTDDQEYEQQNGLLSQWRGYANKDGYAIVFDTKKLAELFLMDADKFYNTYGLIGDVVYEGNTEILEKEFGEQFKTINDSLPHFIKERQWESIKFFEATLSMFTRYKHRGFSEEREVRLVFFPVTKKIEEHHKRLNPNYVPSKKPLKQILYRDPNIPYIKMFGQPNKKLPIKKIIIGPQKEQKRAEEELRRLIGSSGIEIHCSETPLRNKY